MINEDYICDKISRLRVERNISARDMSLSLGQNAGYINSIENKKSLPSMQMFLCICEYLKISPKDFFDEGSDWSPVAADIAECCKKLSEDDRRLVLDVARAIGRTGQQNK